VPEHVVIIGSGPAGWSAAIYAARANLEPLVFEGAVTEANRLSGTLPLGQLALTTEVENYAGFPAGHLAGYLDSAIDKPRRQLMPPPPAEDGAKLAVTGPELMELMRQQAINFGTRVVTDDIVDVDFDSRPLSVRSAAGKTVVAHYLVHRRDQLRASKIMQRRALDNTKIEIVWNHVLEEVTGNPTDGVTGVRLRSAKDGSQREAEVSGVFLAIGHTPNTQFLQGKLALNKKGYIERTVPFRTDASVDGVFSAGDVADDYYRQAITSAGSGCMAALDAERWLVEHELS